MSEILHLWAVASATVGACCVAADRGRPRIAELAASVLMVFAMADAATVSIVPVVVWAAVLTAAAMGLAALRGARRAAAGAGAGSVRAHAAVAMTVMNALGLIVTATLMLAMGAGHADPSEHHHGLSADDFVRGVVMIAIAHAGVAGVLAARPGARVDRWQYAAMGASTLFMAGAVIV